MGLKCGGGMMIDKMIYIQIDANKPSARKKVRKSKSEVRLGLVVSV